MDRLLSLLAVILLSGGAAFAGSRADSVNMSKFSTKSSSLLLPSVACKNAQSSVMDNQSDNYLTNLFENIACDGAGDISSNESLDRNYCSAISKCTYKGKEAIDKQTRGFIKSEALFFLIRELTQAEMKKYLDISKDNFANFLESLDKLPSSVRSKIQTCSKISSPTSCTLGDPFKTKAMQSNIQWILSTGLNSGMQQLIEKRNEMDKMTAASFAKATLAAQENTFEELFEKRKINRTQTIDESIPYKDVVADKLFVDIIRATKNRSVDKLTNEEIHSIVKASLVESGESPDSVFSYNNSDLESQIEQSLKDIKFSAQDFSADNDKSLRDKVSEIRIRVANHHLKTNCSKFNVSLDQVCANVAQKIEKGSVYEMLTNIKEDPFTKMINFYKQSNYRNKDETVEQLEDIKNKKDPIYKKYLVYSLRKNICYEKFPDLKNKAANGEAIPKEEERQLSARLEEMDDAKDRARWDMMASAREVAKLNTSFQKEISDLGLNLNSDHYKIDQYSVENPKLHTKADNVSLREEEGVQSRSFFNDGILAAPNKQIKEQFEAPRQELGTNYLDLAPETKNNSNAEYETKLRARLLDLENKERALSKKMAKNAEDDAPSSEDQKTLSDLRSQIEELKKTQASSSIKRSAGTLDKGQVSALASHQPQSTTFARPVPVSSRGAVESDGGEKITSSSSGLSSGPLAHSESASSNGGSHPGGGLAAEARTNSKNNGEKAMGGLILTKNGEVYQDSANIIENPKEGDIASMLEVTNWRPFLIRENGVIMKVVPELDALGRPQIVKGRVRFKKERLTMAQQEELKKDTNIQKSLKEIDRDPTRLYNLKRLLQNSVKRD